MTDEDGFDYPGEYPGYPDLTGLVVTIGRVAISPHPRARVIGPDQLYAGLLCRCGCGPCWAVKFVGPFFGLTPAPMAFFAHDLTVLPPLEQLALLLEETSGEHASG